MSSSNLQNGIPCIEISTLHRYALDRVSLFEQPSPIYHQLPSHQNLDSIQRGSQKSLPSYNQFECLSRNSQNQLEENRQECDDSNLHNRSKSQIEQQTPMYQKELRKEVYGMASTKQLTNQLPNATSLDCSSQLFDRETKGNNKGCEKEQITEDNRMQQQQQQIENQSEQPPCMEGNLVEDRFQDYPYYYEQFSTNAPNDQVYQNYPCYPNPQIDLNTDGVGTLRQDIADYDTYNDQYSMYYYPDPTQQIGVSVEEVQGNQPIIEVNNNNHINNNKNFNQLPASSYVYEQDYLKVTEGQNGVVSQNQMQQGREVQRAQQVGDVKEQQGSTQHFSQTNYQYKSFYPLPAPASVNKKGKNNGGFGGYSSEDMYQMHSNQIYCDPQYYGQFQAQANNNFKKIETKSQGGLKKPKQRKYEEEFNENEESSLNNNDHLNLNLSVNHDVRKRKRKNNDQLKILKVEYQKGGFWGKEKILEVSQITGLSESQVYKWCWDQKKKRLETFKKKLGGKLMLPGASDGQLDDILNEMSGEDQDYDDEESYRYGGSSPEKYMKLNGDGINGVSSLKAHISKLSNDFTISQLQEKVVSNKSRALTNITDKVLSKQNFMVGNSSSTQYDSQGKFGDDKRFSEAENNLTNFNQENVLPFSQLNLSRTHQFDKQKYINNNQMN